MYRLERLEHGFIACIYQPFTFPKFRPLLQELKPQSNIVAIAASKANEPIGLALAQIQPEQQSSQLLSIYVAPDYRHQGIGTALLQRLETELQQCHCSRAELVYTTGHPTTPYLEQLLHHCDWTTPQPRMLVGKAQCCDILHAPWMQRTKLPSSYRISPWQDMTQTERVALQQEQSINPWIPSYLLPFRHEQNLEPLNSLGLRYQGKIVGWIITHRLAPDTIRYTSGFVRPDLQKMGRYISLLANAIQLQINAAIPFGIWTVPLEFPGMAQFVRDRMSPYLTSLEESRVSHKSLISFQAPIAEPPSSVPNQIQKLIVS